MPAMMKCSHGQVARRAPAALISAAMLLFAGSAAASDRDRAFLLEVVHLEQRLGYEAVCDVTDGLGTTRTSTFNGETNSSVRFIGTRVACLLQASKAGPFEVTLRSTDTVLARAQGAASGPVTIAAR